MAIQKRTTSARNRSTTRELPETMRAAVIDRYGPPSVLKVREIPVPTVRANDVLIQVHTAGVGSWDPEMRSGAWGESSAHFPLVLGSDGSGTVVARGARARRLRVGDKVYAYNFGGSRPGFYAEYVAVPEKNATRTPKRFDLTQAGAEPAIGLTALQGIDDKLQVKRGEHVVIIGASGNVGMMAVQFAKQRGAKVFAIASGRDGVGFARRLGADVAVDGKKADVAAALDDFAPDGVDAILALVGGKLVSTSMDALAKGGRVAYPNGIDPAPRKRKGIKLISYDADGGTQALTRLNRAFEKGGLRVPIAKELPLARADQAHRRIEHGHVLGRIVLHPRSRNS